VHRTEYPESWHLSRSAYLGLYLATRVEPSSPERARPFRDRERLLEALAREILAVDDTVRVGGRVTTAGRYLVAECVPPAFRDEVVKEPCTAKRLEFVLSRVLRDEHVEIAARAAAAMESLGRAYADRSGVSPAHADFAPAEENDALVAEGRAYVAGILEQYQGGLITDGERYDKTVDQWAYTHDLSCMRAAQRAAAREALDPLAAVAATDRDAPRPDRLRGIVGLVAKSSGEIVEVPVLHTRGEGLTAHEFMITCRGARGVTLSAHERDRVAATLLHDLDAVLGGTKITERDCKTTRGVRLEAVLLDFDTMVSLASRIEGRVAAADVVSPRGVLLARTGSLLGRRVARAIDEACVPWVVVRDPLGCASEEGVCAVCFGLDPDDATWLADGDAIGTRAATTIAHEARRFSQRWLHIC